jgi:Cu-processing system permease protein
LQRCDRQSACGRRRTAAFGAASLAFLRFTKGIAGAALLLSASIAVWLVAPVWLAARRLKRADI